MKPNRTTDERPARESARVCPDCRGTGRYPTRIKNADGSFRDTSVACLRCRGTGTAGGGYLTK